MVIRPDSFIRNSSDFSPSWRWCSTHTFLWKWNLQHLLFSQASLSPMLFVVVSFGRVLKPPWQHFSKKMPAVSTTLMFLILQTVWSEITSTTYFWMIYFLAELAHHHLTKVTSFFYYHNIYLFTLLLISIPWFSGKIEAFDSWLQEVWIVLWQLFKKAR